MSIFASFRDYIDALVHPTARQDVAAMARHRAFIAPRLLGSFAALAAFPIYLVMRGVPSAAEIAIVAWLVTPILIACFLSRTGRYEAAHMLSSLALTGLVTAVAFNTGGLSSFAAIWLVIVPLEAALSASRRVVAVAALFALTATVFLLAIGSFRLLPDASAVTGETMAALGIASAALYAAGVALGGEVLVRGNFLPPPTEEENYQKLFRHMIDVVTRHGRNGAVLSISPAAGPLFGCRLQDLRGHGLFDRVHVGDRPAYLTAIANAAAADAVTAVEFRMRCGSGEHGGPGNARFRWIEMRCRPTDTVMDDGTREVVGVLRDVSDRKAQEQALTEAHMESERANMAKSRFVATMSHELRTPLNVIIGFSEMLSNEQALLDSTRREEYARLINESGHHLLSIVNGLLDMSKIEAGSFEITREPFAVSAVVKSCSELMALKASQSGIALEQRVAEGIPDVLGDKRAVSQILLNLLSNAVKFTDRGGHVRVTASCHAGYAVIEVEDDGAGIDADDLPRLGDPYFQAKASYDRRYEGTGLGLSIVKGLVKLHGGDLDIQSRVGQGTRVTVRLPIDGGTVQKPESSSAAARAMTETTIADHRVKKIA